MSETKEIPTETKKQNKEVFQVIINAVEGENLIIDWKCPRPNMKKEKQKRLAFSIIENAMNGLMREILVDDILVRIGITKQEKPKVITPEKFNIPENVGEK